MPERSVRGWLPKEFPVSECRAVLVLLILGWVLAPRVVRSEVIALRGVTVIDGTGAPPLPDAVVLIEGERIRELGKAIAIPAGARVLSLEGHYVIPGLIDGHVHYRNWLGELLLNHGVTTVLDLGNLTEWILAVQQGVKLGRIPAPRILTSGNNLESAEEEPDIFSSRAGLTKRSWRYKTFLHTPEEARSVVRRMAEQGVDLIKVYQSLRPPALSAITEEAHRLGLAVVGHTDDAFESAAAGLNAITHLWGTSETCLSPEEKKLFSKGGVESPYARMHSDCAARLIQELVARNVYLNPLLSHEHKAVSALQPDHESEDYGLLRNPDLGYIPLDARLGMLSMYDRVRNYARRYATNFPRLSELTPEDRELFRRGRENSQRFVRDFVRAGGKLFMGTDSGGGAKEVPGLAVHQELEEWVAAGLSPMEALVAATRNPAQLAGRKDLGTLRPGSYADLVVLEASPLENIRNTRKIRKVFLAGREVKLGYDRNYAIPITDPLRMELESSSYYPVPAIANLSPIGVREGAPDPGDGREVLRARLAHGLHRSERPKQSAFARRPDAIDVIERRAHRAPRADLLVVRHREAVRFVADALKQVVRRAAHGQRDRVGALRDEYLFGLHARFAVVRDEPPLLRERDDRDL